MTILGQPQAQDAHKEDISKGLDSSWEKFVPVIITGTIETRQNKELRATNAGEWQLVNPGSASPINLLNFKTSFEWAHDGERMLSRRRYVSPSVIVSQDAVIDGKWSEAQVWDGQRSISLQVTAGSTIQANIIPLSKDVDIKKELKRIAKFGSDMLLCAPDGSSWAEFISEKSVEITHSTWRNEPSVLLTWREQWDKPVSSTIWVVPSRGYLVTRQEFKGEKGKILLSTELKSLQQTGDAWYPKEIEQTIYDRMGNAKVPTPKARVTYFIDDIRISAALPENTFEFAAEELPKGSRVMDLGARTANYVGAELREEDAILLYDALKTSLEGELSLSDLRNVLPQTKTVSFPRNCGPYSLLAMCRILGISATLQELTMLAETDDQGITTVAGLVKALKNKRVDAKAVALQTEDISSIQVPAIIHIQPEHFVVLLRREADVFFLLDPPTRVFVMTPEQLQQTWSGYAVINVGEGFPLSTKKASQTQTLKLDTSAILPPVEADPTAVVGLPIPKVEVGQAAPEFSFLDMNGQTRRLSDLRGKKNLLLTFFPRCFTGGCAGQLASLRDMQSDFAATDTEIWAVSVDPAEGEKGQVAFAKFLNLNFPLIPDPERKLSLLYGATQDKQQLAARMSVIIDKSGTVRLVDTHVHIATHGADLLKKMRDLGMNK